MEELPTNLFDNGVDPRKNDKQ